MFADIVLPQGNEEEFISIAEKLGYDCLALLYTSCRRLEELQRKTRIKLISAVVADARRAGNIKDALVFIKAGNDSRSIFENKAVDVVFGLEATGTKDGFHQRNSGFNHVTASLAFDNRIAVAFNLSELINDDRRETLIGRISQNIKLCRKYKVQTIIASFAREPFQMRAPLDIKSFFEVIGMSPGEAKKALSCVHNKFVEKQHQDKVIKEGIEIVE